MLNGKWTALTEHYLNGQRASQLAIHSPIHTHSHVNGKGVAKQSQGLSIGSNLRFSVFPKEISTCGQEEPAIKLSTQRLVDNLLYLLSHRGHKNMVCKRACKEKSDFSYQEEFS